MRLLMILAMTAYAVTESLSFSQGTTVPSVYTLSGTVRLPDGTPGARAVVRISSQTGLNRQVIADNEGRFEVHDLPRGRFRLTATNPNDADQVSEYSEIDTGRTYSNAVAVTLYLRHRPDKMREVASSPVVSARETAQHVPRQARRSFEEGVRRGSEGKLEQAEVEFTRAISAYPDYPQALAERGNVRVAAGRVEAAAEDFARALEIDPNYGPALRGSGICKFQTGRPADAVPDLEKAAAAEPTVARNYMFLGLACMALDRREQASSAFQRALALDPKGSARARVHLANVYIKDNQPAQAMGQIEAYLAAVPNAPDKDKLLAVAAQLRASLR